MAARSRWRRFDAEHWVHQLGMLQTTVLTLATLWAATAGFLAGALWVAVIPGAAASLTGWLTAAWRRDERWSWPAWSVLSGVGAVVTAGPLAGGQLSWAAAGGFVVNAPMLVLLFHPDSRARFAGPDPAVGPAPGRAAERHAP
jgi:hypothetical protein